jgi:hypothetical protein
MSNSQQQETSLSERIATIETDIKWVKWLVVGSFVSSSVGTAVKLGAPAPATAVVGIVATVLGLTR